MIEINLLPPEHRPVERTPLPRLMTILSGVLLTMFGLVLWAWLTFVMIPDASNTLSESKNKEAARKLRADDVHKLEEKLEKFSKREAALGRLFKERIRWTRVLDRVAEARVANTDVVLTDVEFKKTTSTGVGLLRGKAVKQLHVQGYVPSFADHAVAAHLTKSCMAFVGTLRKDSQWNEIFEKHPDYKKFEMIDRMAQTGLKKKAGLPKSGLKFHVIFTFKPTEPVQQPGLPPAGRPPVARR